MIVSWHIEVTFQVIAGHVHPTACTNGPLWGGRPAPGGGGGGGWGWWGGGGVGRRVFMVCVVFGSFVGVVVDL